MEDKKVVVSGGTSLSTLLTVAFVVLKLCGVISWSWFWVFSPIIFAWGIAVLLIVITSIIVILADRY